MVKMVKSDAAEVEASGLFFTLLWVKFKKHYILQFPERNITSLLPPKYFLSFLMIHDALCFVNSQHKMFHRGVKARATENLGVAHQNRKQVLLII